MTRTTVWYVLKTLDGRTLASTHGSFGRWQWILDNVTSDAKCQEDDVDVEEALEGDYVTVRGKRYATVTSSFVGADGERLH